MASSAARENSAQLVEEQHAAVGQRQLAGPRPGCRRPPGPARETVWWGERNGRSVHQPPGAEARGAVDLGDLERLVEATSGGRIAGQPAGQHRLARSRRADHQQVVAAGRGDLERALGVGVPADVAELEVGRRRAGSPLALGRRLGRPLAAQQATIRLEVGHRQHLEPATPAQPPRRSPRGRSGARSRPGARPDREGQRAAHRPQPAAQRELAAQRVRASRSLRHLAGRGQQADRDAPGRSSRRACARARARGWPPAAAGGNSSPEFRTAARTRSRDSRTARSARPTSVKVGKPAARVDLDGDLAAADPVEGEGGDAGEHGRQR